MSASELGTGDLVILEGKWEASSGLLENQLDDRLDDFPEALAIIGLLYPNRLRHEDDLFGHLRERLRSSMVAPRLARRS